MRCLLLLALAGCTMDSVRLYWNLDAPHCARVNASVVEWVWLRDNAVIEQVGFPCGDGGDGMQVDVPAQPYTMVVSLEGADSHVLAHCTPTQWRGDYSCNFAVP